MLDWGTIALLGALAATAAWFSWRTPTRLVGVTLPLNIIFCVIMVVIFGDDSEAAANAIGEIAILMATIPAILDRPVISASLLTLSTISCCTTLSFVTSSHPDTYAYEVTVNVILAMQCVIVANTEFWHVVADSFARFYRWHMYRRRFARLFASQLAGDPPRDRA